MRFKLFFRKTYFVLFFGVCVSNAYATWCVDESLVSLDVERGFSRAAVKFLNDAPAPLPRLRTEGLMPDKVFMISL